MGKIKNLFKARGDYFSYGACIAREGGVIMRIKELGRLIASILVCQAAGVFGSVFTVSSIPTWYASLNKPSFNPPNWLFGPVWIALYTLMGISLFLVWKGGAESREVKASLGLFGFHLFLNALWSFLFFGLRNPMIGFVGIVLVLATLLLVIKRFYGISKDAGLILIPYLLWVGFATVLNFSIWILNL